jgi:transcriptional regulator with XRE-family HTH domain
MTFFDGPSIGARIAFYRKLNGWSMSELSTRTSGRIKSPVIANIESGRKVDISVDQLMTFASALQMSPTALLFDIRQPASQSGVRIINDDGDMTELTTVGAIRWLAGQLDELAEDAPVPPSRTSTSEILNLYQNLDAAHAEYSRLLFETSGADPNELKKSEAASREYHHQVAALRQLGGEKHDIKARLKRLGVEVE